ncbi:probable mediator of RNA polymerase II transcription subunit 26b [Asparagus officinalis]|uniref:probable mediator of RNA polymerase II transcription subunit 26b n=1 Tax=Asparagus officinalis TaxID=4686 RepID=UPI00098E04C8|nr:probable mediator of RNA polymerase II transcription subunit 26b [Asparagus officinalis]
MEVEGARERRVRLVIKSGGVVVARSCRLYAVKDDPAQEEEKKSEELPRKRLRLNGEGSAPTEAATPQYSTAADVTSCAAKNPMENLRRKRVEPTQHPRQSTKQAPSRPADKTDVKITEESRSPPADKPPVQIAQNLSLGEKFEITKRKLHQSYQESNNARKQRSVKVLEVDELPKKQGINEEKLREKKRALMKKRIHMPSFRLRR